MKGIKVDLKPGDMLVYLAELRTLEKNLKAKNVGTGFSAL